MKLICFLKDNKEMYGVVENNNIRIINGDIFKEYTLTDEIVSIDRVKILPPCKPTKAVCVGLNYKDHAEEMKLELPKSPTLFIKPSTCVIGHMDYIEYPKMSNRVDYECEMVIVIGKKAKAVNIEKAKEYIIGYTCGNDVTARDLQTKDGQWTVAKSFDSFLPFGPFIETEVDPLELNIKTYLNGEVKQKSNTKNLIFNAYELVSYISNIMTLYPGDIIMTGTPSGIGPMQKGDIVDIEIEHIGKLTNYIR